MKIRYKRRLFFWFFVIFAVFTAGIILLEQAREKKQKTEALVSNLNVYADIADAALTREGNHKKVLDSLLRLFPLNMRLTLINNQGEVLYDNTTQTTENHLNRPEILSAKENGSGTYTRTSATHNKTYIYYAKYFGKYYIRIALPYDINVRNILKPDNFFLYYVLAMFLVMLLLINLVSERFGKSIEQLRDFTRAAQDENNKIPDINFPDDELGEIGAKIAESYQQLRENKKIISLEREKLLQHIHTSEEGICFFSAGKEVEFYNGLFIQYLNVISDESQSVPSSVLAEPAFEKLFVQDHDEPDYREVRISKHGKHFAARINIFEDNGFEVVINDITDFEKNRLLKQEMTSNIAHELRTPVTTIRGYLETLLAQPLDADKQHLFISRAYNQTIVLSELISDMSLITKIEEAPHSFHLEDVNIKQLLEDLRNDLVAPLQEKEISMEWNMPDHVVVRGNKNLLYSIFRNLTDNAIRYAGQGISIHVNKYDEDHLFYYFSYSDTGIGIPDEQHLNRLFERFYRINEGRTRDTGGSGLGLSIVKNAIAFHRGTIVAKSIPGKGLRFLFKLPKSPLSDPSNEKN